MRSVSIPEAKANLSRLLESLETGREREIVIARRGRAVARLTLVESPPVERRIGVARGRFVAPDDIDVDNAAIVSIFEGTGGEAAA